MTENIPQTTAQQKIGLGILCGLGNSLALVTSSTMVKLATEHHHAVDVFFWRSVGVLIMSFALLVALKQLPDIKKTNHKAQIFRGVLGAITMLLAFMSYDYLPIAQAQLFFFLSPLIIVALSYPLLGEAVGIYRGSAVVVGLLGAAIILQPGALENSTGALLGIGVTIFYASVTICLRWMGKTENANVTVFYFSLVSTILSAPFAPFFIVIPTFFTLMLILGIIVASFIIQMCLTYSYKLAPAAIIAPLIYLNLIWALTADYFIFEKTPTAVMLSGAGVIIASNLFILWREHQMKQKGKKHILKPEYQPCEK